MKYTVVIGYDRNNRMPAYTAAESIMRHSSKPINFIFLHRDMLKMFTRERTDKDSTDFSISRFLTPYLSDYTGWSLFLDNDIVVKGDIVELFNLSNSRYSVMCVKHNQVVENTAKFLNHSQLSYKYKNWSSVMLFNNSRCTILTPEYVNIANGLSLHQFKWLDDDSLIGELPLEWNYLVDNKNQSTSTPKLIHYTNGGPYFKEYLNCEYASDWLDIYNSINDVRSFK